MSSPAEAAPQLVADALDPRIRRTRQMLHEALDQMLESESIEKISVSDIAEKAMLNRATFYDHYADKYALLEGMVASRFQDLLIKRQVVFNGGCSAAMMSIILAMCDFLAGLPGFSCPDRRQMETHFESALIAVVRRTLLDGFAHHPPEINVSPELIAATMSGAIYSGAKEWVRTPSRRPADQVAKSIHLLVGRMFQN